MARLPFKKQKMKNLKVKPRYKKGILKGDGRTMEQTRITVDHQETTIQDIFEASNQGLLRRPDPGHNNDGDNAIDLEEFSRLDLVEQNEIIQDNKAYLDKIKAAYKKKEAQEVQAVENEVEEKPDPPVDSKEE